MFSVKISQFLGNISELFVSNKSRSICDVTEILNLNSVYLIASLHEENAEGPKDTVELCVE